jgi:catechol 2,3-dioxygenase-like lactoylglutathione lyase family enzyme
MIGDNTTHANFSVDDIDAAKDFYVKKLGFMVKKETGEDVMLESGKGTRLNLYYKPDHAAGDMTVFGIEVDDISEAVSDLNSRGVPIEKVEGTDTEGILHDADMGDAAWFRDPAGNWLCVNHFATA